MFNQIKKILKQKINTNKTYFVSFPKSGRTWMELLFGKIISDLSGEDLNSVLNKKTQKRYYKESKRSLPSLIFGHGHKNGKMCQNNFFPKLFYWKEKIILLVRDPRDVLVSHYYYQKYNHNLFSGSISNFIRYDNSDNSIQGKQARYGVRAIINYMNTWVDNKNIFKNIKIIYFEDLKKDIFKEVKDICRFAGIECSDEIINKAIEYSSFENMRKIEESGELNWHGLPNPKDKRGLKTRKGKVGGYKDEVSEDDQLFISEKLQELDDEFNRYKY